MQKTIFNLIAGRFICVSILLFCSSFEVKSQIVLNDQPAGFKPETFFIADVTDDRTDKTTIGQLAISYFLQHNLTKNHTLKPIVIGIKELSIQETPQKERAQTGSSVDGLIRLSLSFGLQKDYGTEHLVNYKGSMQYTRYGAGAAAIESYLRNILKGSLEYLDNWMKNNTPVNRKLAKSVKLSFTDHQEKPEGDTIYYAANRPLTWDDFQSRSRPTGVFAAQVIPGIGYTQEAQMDKGMIEVTINMKTYLPKSASRANYSARDAYALNHEQRHFDIAKIITEQFKKKLLAKLLTPDTFEAAINMQYFDSYRDLDAMQKAYDTETKHGIDQVAQSAWNSRIDKELNPNSQLP